MTGLSIKQNGAFYGFSVEMSVAENVCECPLSYPERSVETGTIHGLIHTSKILLVGRNRWLIRFTRVLKRV